MRGSINGHPGPTAPKTDPGRKLPAWVLFVVAALLVSAGTAGLEVLARSAQTPNLTASLVHTVGSSASRERAIESAAIARGSATLTLQRQGLQARADAVEALQHLIALAGSRNAFVRESASSLAAFHTALDQTLAALRTGGRGRALALDRGLVGPGWTKLDLSLATAAAVFDRSGSTRWWILAIALPAILLLVALGAAILAVRASGNKTEELKLQSQRAAREHAERGRRELLARTVQAAEDERTRIAAELHDGPVQRLTAVDYLLQRMLGQLRKGDAAKAAEVSTKAQLTIREEIGGLRRMMSDLRPPVLDQRGLVEALREYAGRLGPAAGIACTVDSKLDDRLSPASETVLYRVAQEALQNVYKHSKAKAARISLRQSEGWVRLEVQDDGVGYESSAGPDAEGRHFGMLGMKERVEMVGGRWDVFSRPGQGTRVAAILPKEPVR